MSQVTDRAGFTLDPGRCVACGACVLACRMENRVQAGVSWRRLLSLNDSRHPGGPSYHFSVACHHCEDPACLAACPSTAYRQLPDGTVHLDMERCIGCRYCEMACPFGAPAFDAAAGVMTKCHFCTPRREAGGRPACVEACPTGALRTLEPEAGVELPGFADRVGCRPALRLVTPGGEIRSARLERLLDSSTVAGEGEGGR